MLDPIGKAMPAIPGVDQLPTVEQARALLSQVHAVAPERVSIAARAKADAGIPPRFATADLETWAATTPAQVRVRRVLQRFAGNFEQARKLGSNLVFRGEVGSGKTTLACGVVRAVSDRGFSARYVSRIGAYFRQMREAFSGDGQSASKIEAGLARPDLLVLDEVGVQYGSKAELVMLTELIDERYAHQRPTIVVSNLAGAALAELVGERAADRLAENGVELVFDWPSFRRGGRGGAA